MDHDVGPVNRYNSAMNVGRSYDNGKTYARTNQFWTRAQCR
jgi:hypothetical protein